MSLALEDIPKASVAKSLFGFGDSTLLAILDTELRSRLADEEIQELFDKLKSKLYAGVGSSDIRQLHTVMVNSKRSSVKPALPLWNIRNPTVVFVSQTPPLGGSATDFFVKTLKDVGFSSSQCAWTSINRTDAEGEDPRLWLDFLYSEIRIWAPRVVVPLGLEPSSILLSDRELRLSDVLGETLWMGPWAVIPCMSPAYAVKSGKEDLFSTILAKTHRLCFGTTT